MKNKEDIVLSIGMNSGMFLPLVLVPNLKKILVIESTAPCPFGETWTFRTNKIKENLLNANEEYIIISEVDEKDICWRLRFLYHNIERELVYFYNTELIPISEWDLELIRINHIIDMSDALPIGNEAHRAEFQHLDTDHSGMRYVVNVSNDLPIFKVGFLRDLLQRTTADCMLYDSSTVYVNSKTARTIIFRKHIYINNFRTVLKDQLVHSQDSLNWLLEYLIKINKNKS